MTSGVVKNPRRRPNQFQMLCRWREFVMGMAFIFLLLVFKFLGTRYK